MYAGSASGDSYSRSASCRFASPPPFQICSIFRKKTSSPPLGTPNFSRCPKILPLLVAGSLLVTRMTLFWVHTTSRQTIHMICLWELLADVMSLLFNMLFSLAIAFLPRSKHLLISWLQSPSAVILEPPKIKSVTVSIVSPSIFLEVMGQDAMIFVF